MTIRYKTYLLTKALSALVASAVAGTAMAADLPLWPKVRSQAQTGSEQTSPVRKSEVTAKNRTARGGNDITGSIAWPERARAALNPTIAAISYAYSARATFAKARGAMESAILLREDVPKSNAATLQAATADVLSELKALELVTHTSPSEAMKKAPGLVQDWSDAGLKIIKPPAGGVTALPFPTTVAAKADAVSAALDRLIEEANASVQANLSRRRSELGVRPLTRTGQREVR